MGKWFYFGKIANNNNYSSYNIIVLIIIIVEAIQTKFIDKLLCFTLV